MKTEQSTIEAMKTYVQARNRRDAIADRLLNEDSFQPAAADITAYLHALWEERRAEDRIQELFLSPTHDAA